MWQRIQTLYLAVALGLLVAMFWHVTYLWWLILLGTSCFMQVVAVLAYKFRLFQMRTAIIAALMLLGLQVWMVVAFLTGDKGAFNITAVFPVVAAILDARTNFKLLSGGTHYAYTGYCIISPKGTVISKLVKTTIKTKKFTPDEIDTLIASKEWQNVAAYGIEGVFSTLVKDIQGSYTNIIGLPVYEVTQDLKKVLK